MKSEVIFYKFKFKSTEGVPHFWLMIYDKFLDPLCSLSKWSIFWLPLHARVRKNSPHLPFLLLKYRIYNFYLWNAYINNEKFRHEKHSGKNLSESSSTEIFF